VEGIAPAASSIRPRRKTSRLLRRSTSLGACPRRCPVYFRLALRVASGDVWAGLGVAGKPRTCDLNIGSKFYDIEAHVLDLADTIPFWGRAVLADRGCHASPLPRGQDPPVSEREWPLVTDAVQHLAPQARCPCRSCGRTPDGRDESDQGGVHRGNQKRPTGTISARFVELHRQYQQKS